ncbi:epididymal-specific lipocalin-9 [Tupaia chinensis]|uniref:epididymal-specific lipocalin-9 n=1 Tax=Tupaia chinensis TaxID=246437 RepID=UPI0003C8FF7A|nr:epididymal-specific lipocalin-9 [Tupaia chinensis]
MALLLLGLGLTLACAQDFNPRAVVQRDYNMLCREPSPATHRVQGECVAVAVVCEKTEKNGQYSIVYEGQNRLLVSETDYGLYVTFYLHNVHNGTQTRVLALYGRIPQLSPMFLSRFERTCKKYGLGSENIIDLTNQDHCYSRK